MESLFLELKAILEVQKETMKQLLNTAREHNRALRQLDMELLNTVLRREEELTAALNRQDKVREKIAAGLSEAAFLPGDATLGLLAGRAPAHLEKDIGEISDEMKSIVSQLRELNDQNGMLTKQAMRVNEMMLNALAPGRKKTYSPQGVAKESIQVSLLDKKA
ncbi:MAG: flagellar protein FlgN [Bacillota bacterium]